MIFNIMLNQFFFRKSDYLDVPLIQSILEKAPSYSLHVEGYLPSPGAALNTLTSLPPKKDFSPEQKFVHIIYHKEKPIGLTDCLVDYPSKGTVFVGLFLLIESEQNKGLGKKAFTEYEKLVLDSFLCKKIRLCVIETNPVSDFWIKQGFVFTGEKNEYEAGLVKSFSLLMEKKFK